MPKFVETPRYPDLRRIALPDGTPSKIPLTLSSHVGSVSSFETLFSFEDAEGRPVAMAHPGTYEPWIGLRAGRT